MWTLDRLVRQRGWRAGDGARGGGSNKKGSQGKDLVIEVPVGTLVSILGGTREGQAPLLADLKEEGQSLLVASGGQGGWGNSRYVSSRQQTPRRADAGEPGEELILILERKLLADVGLVSYPSAGKSTLLRAVSAARPEVAAYPYATREPVVGLVRTGKTDFFLAEMPALAEGAYEGRGLGNDFLRHLERPRVLVHLLDGSRPDPSGDWRHLRNELALYKVSLTEKPEVVVVNKMDLPEVRERLPEIKAALAQVTGKVHFISAATGQGLPELMAAVAEILAAAPAPIPIGTPEGGEAVFRPLPQKRGPR